MKKNKKLTNNWKMNNLLLIGILGIFLIRLIAFAIAEQSQSPQDELANLENELSQPKRIIK